MILDSSAIIAILRDEPERPEFNLLIDAAPRVGVSAATMLEAAIVAGADRAALLDDFIREGAVEVLPFDADQARVACEAHRRFGRGSGSSARLNLGDCFAYALAKVAEQPLLFKGDDFTHTDVTPAR